MKKCSKSAHHTMSELNITPLLDLAFVLLVIFIITTTPIIPDMDLSLPTASKRLKDPPKKAYNVSIDAAGGIWMNQKPVVLQDVQPKLAIMRVDDPDLNVIVRADGKTKYGRVRAVLDACQGANLGKVDLATDPAK
jgi:biopolymer transport protein ExbD